MIKIIKGNVRVKPGKGILDSDIQVIKGDPVFELDEDQILVVDHCSMADDDYATHFYVMSREQFEKEIKPRYYDSDIVLDNGYVSVIDYSD